MSQLPDLTKFHPLDICMYCDAKADLTDEHIIPLSLGGRHVLPDSSCLDCARIINREFEQYVARHVFQDVRIEFGLPTRNPRQRPTHLPLRQGFAPSPETAPIMLVPTKDYPGVLMLLTLEPAGIIQGRAPDSCGTVGMFIRQITGQDRVEALQKRGIDSKIYRQLKFEPVMRLFAKIAFGSAVATHGLDSFEPSPIRDAILRNLNPYYLVGGTTIYMDEFPLRDEILMGHRWVLFKRAINKVPFLMAQIQLFAFLDAPIYTVVLGKLTDAGLNKFVT